MSVEHEEWRAVPGHEGWYEVSTHGRIRSLRFKNRSADYVLVEPRVKVQHVNVKTGYPSVRIRSAGGTKTVTVHSLMLMAFRGPRPSKKHCCGHRDGTRTNNHLSNVEWITYSQNTIDSIRHGTYRGPRKVA